MLVNIDIFNFYLRKAGFIELLHESKFALVALEALEYWLLFPACFKRGLLQKKQQTKWNVLVEMSQ